MVQIKAATFSRTSSPPLKNHQTNQPNQKSKLRKPRLLAHWCNSKKKSDLLRNFLLFSVLLGMSFLWSTMFWWCPADVVTGMIYQHCHYKPHFYNLDVHICCYLAFLIKTFNFLFNDLIIFKVEKYKRFQKAKKKGSFKKEGIIYKWQHC